MAEGKIVLMCLLVIAVAIAIGFFTWHSEFSIRAAGYVLQLVGMIFAIRGLLCIREHFGQVLLREIFFNWLKRFPGLKRNNDIVMDGVVTFAMTPKSRLEVWSSDNSDAPIEKRRE
jgi:hypothetical protein